MQFAQVPYYIDEESLKVDKMDIYRVQRSIYNILRDVLRLTSDYGKHKGKYKGHAC